MRRLLVLLLTSTGSCSTRKLKSSPHRGFLWLGTMELHRQCEQTHFADHNHSRAPKNQLCWRQVTKHLKRFWSAQEITAKGSELPSKLAPIRYLAESSSSWKHRSADHTHIRRRLKA